MERRGEGVADGGEKGERKGKKKGRDGEVKGAEDVGEVVTREEKFEEDNTAQGGATRNDERTALMVSEPTVDEDDGDVQTSRLPHENEIENGDEGSDLAGRKMQKEGSGEARQKRSAASTDDNGVEAQEKTRKRKKKSKNAIDDLFSGW